MVRIKPEHVAPVRRITREEAEQIYPPDPRVAEIARLEVERQVEQEARAFALSTEPGEHIRPRDLQSITKGAISFNAACRVLEALEKDGELVREPHHLSWRKAGPPQPPGNGYALPLSSREHGALLRLLDEHFRDPYNSSDDATLRAIRSRMKRPA